MAKLSKNAPILVVGAGLFGLSTALELRQRGYEEITVLDRMLPPVKDGSSVDINRVIRCDYTDPFYANLAREAIGLWKTSPLYSPFYHHTGFVLVSDGKQNDEYFAKNKANLKQMNQDFIEYHSTEAFRRKVPGLQGMNGSYSGYMNPNGGWANAAAAIKALSNRCSELGISFITGRRGTVVSLITEEARVTGVNVASGEPILASQVIMATGAWTNRYLNLDQSIDSSAQPIGFLQLTEDEARSLANIPVVQDYSSGVFFIPPTPDTNILKVACHGHGFENEVPSDEHSNRLISGPKRDSNNEAANFLPQDADQYLREGLRKLIPFAADKPWSKKRICWYTETPTGNLIADFHPSISGLFVATGGSGHAFKFLPVLGRHLADCFEGIASEELKLKWQLPQVKQVGRIACNDGSRRGPYRRVLTRDEQARL